MKRLPFLTLILSLSLAACALQTRPTPQPTLLPTTLPLPTAAVTLTPTSFPTLTSEQIATWDDISAKVANSVNQADGVKEVHRVALDGRHLTISLQTKWLSSDLQPQVSYQVIRQLAWFCSVATQQQVLEATGVAAPTIRLLTESPDGNSVYFSTTTYQQCYFVSAGDLSFRDWQSQAGLVRSY